MVLPNRYDPLEFGFAPACTQIIHHNRRRQMTKYHDDLNYDLDLGTLVARLMSHEPGDWGDCSLNDPIVSVIDKRQTAAEFIQALREMPRDHLARLAEFILEECAV